MRPQAAKRVAKAATMMSEVAAADIIIINEMNLFAATFARLQAVLSRHRPAHLMHDVYYW